MPEPVALAIESDTTLMVAELPVRVDRVLVPVKDTPVGAMVVEGSMIPEGPKRTVVPSITVVTMVLSAPAPILYVVPLMIASDESMLKVKSPMVVTT